MPNKRTSLLLIALLSPFAAAAPTSSANLLQPRNEHCWAEHPEFDCRVSDAVACINELSAKGDLPCSARYGILSVFCKHESCQIFGQNNMKDPSSVAHAPCKDVARGIAKVLDWCVDPKKDGWVHGWNNAWDNGNLYVDLRSSSIG